MADDAALRKLIDDHHHGVLVTLKRDGRPQLSNVAYAVFGDEVHVSVTEGRVKTKNLRRDQRVSLHVTRSDFFAYAVVEGKAELMPVTTDPHDATTDALVEYYRAVAGEHDDWEEYRTAMVNDQRLIVKVPIERLYGMA